MRRHLKVYWVTCVLMMVGLATAKATTIVMPTDEQLVSKAPVIVTGTVISSTPVDRGQKIWTETVVQLSGVLKGDVSGESVTIREVGGVIGDRITKIFGAPEYHAGERVLLFLTPTPRGDYQTIDLYVGKFTGETMLNGTPLWARHDEAGDVALVDADFRPIHARNVQRRADSFQRFVTERVAGRKGVSNYGIENPVLAPRAAVRDAANGLPVSDNFTLISEPTIYRWFTFESGGNARWYSYGTQPGYSGGGAGEVQTAMAAWNNYSAAKISYLYSGAGSGSPAGLDNPNGTNEVLFNDPLSEIAGSWNPSTGGVVGVGGFNGVSSGGNWTAPFTADASHTQGTFHAYNITEGNLVIQDNVQPSQGLSSARLAEIICHEFGHTLGFGHSTDNTALMYPTVTGLGPSLRADDQLAARWLYPNGTVVTPPPTVPAAPSGLSATANGTNVNLQWVDNASNETGQSIYWATGNGSFSKLGDVNAGQTTATLTGFTGGTYRFYVVAYNSAGTSTASNTATVSIAVPLQAAFTLTPSNGVAGQTTFVFTDQSTGSIDSRVWQFGDGANSTNSSPTHLYANTGTYIVTLTVFSGGNQSSASRSLIVSAPQAALAAAFAFTPASPAAGETVSFIDQSTGGSTSWQWSFGDGTSSALENPTKTYASAGTYTVAFTAYRNLEAAAVSKTITVRSGSPVTPSVNAAFDAQASASVGESVAFTDRSTGSPTSWNWSFGDGAASSVQNPTHPFSAPGIYTVTLSASNGSSTSLVSHTVTVSAVIVPYRSLISAAAQTDGVGGSTWRTELTLFNAGTEAANVNLIFIPGGGGSSQTRPLLLGRRQSVTYANALADIFGLSSGAGALSIEATSATSSPNLKVTSRTFTNGTTGTYGQSVPQVGNVDLDTTLYLTGLASSAAYRTNIGLVNKSASTITTGLILFDPSGSVIASTTVTVPGNNFQQSALSSYFPALASRSYEGLSMKVTAPQAGVISVYASVVDNRTQDPIYIQGMPASNRTSMTLPAVGRAPGANGTFWRSDLTLFNPGALSMTVTLRLHAPGASPSQYVALSAGQTVVLSDVVGSLGLSSASGSLDLSWTGATAPVVGSRTYTSTTEGGTFGQSIDPVAAFANDIYVPGLRADGAYRSNVGFVNDSNSTIGVTVSLLASNGDTVGTANIALAGKSQGQYPIASLFPSVNAAVLGTFTLQAHTDGAPSLFAYGSIVDNASGDPVFFAGQ
ncbi:MAG: cell surface protein [Acidobacteria bacterium]|nr:cell surface protein [Acidobacteriota bacterium]